MIVTKKAGGKGVLLMTGKLLHLLFSASAMQFLG
jgi:hypothetical protein